MDHLIFSLPNFKDLVIFSLLCLFGDEFVWLTVLIKNSSLNIFERKSLQTRFDQIQIIAIVSIEIQKCLINYEISSEKVCYKSNEIQVWFKVLMFTGKKYKISGWIFNHVKLLLLPFHKRYFKAIMGRVTSLVVNTCTRTMFVG